MRKLYFLLLLCPYLGIAQMEFGVNYGTGPFSISKKYNQSGGYDTLGNSDHWVQNSSHNKSRIFDITVSYHISNWKIGLGYSSSSLSHKMHENDTSIQLYSAVGGDSVFKTFITDFNSTYYITSPLNDYYAFASYTKYLGRSEVYVGGAIGYLSYKSKAGTPGSSTVTKSGNTTFTNNSGNEYYEGEGKGSAIKILAGYTYNLYKGFCLNIQIGADYMTIKNTYGPSYIKKTETETILFFPLTAGIHYKIGHKK